MEAVIKFTSYRKYKSCGSCSVIFKITISYYDVHSGGDGVLNSSYKKKN